MLWKNEVWKTEFLYFAEFVNPRLFLNYWLQKYLFNSVKLKKLFQLINNENMQLFARVYMWPSYLGDICVPAFASYSPESHTQRHYRGHTEDIGKSSVVASNTRNPGSISIPDWGFQRVALLLRVPA